MAKWCLVFGGLLIALGSGIYFNTPEVQVDGVTKSRMTALIPAFVGALLLLLGVVTMLKPALTKHTMHVAAMVGLLGFVGGLTRPIMVLAQGGELKMGPPLVGQLGMTALCGVFVFLCVRSFRDARKAREANARAA